MDTKLQEQDINSSEDYKIALRNDPAVLALTNDIDYRDQVSLIEYAKESASSISSFSDKVLATVKSSSMQDSGVLLNQLGKLMDKFDANDFKEDKGGLFSKIFNTGNKMVEKLFAKYNTMGAEIDKIYIEIKKYEDEMKKSTVTLDSLFNENYNYFLELQKYIVAAELKRDELNEKLTELKKRADSGDQYAAIEVNTVSNAVEVLDQRIYDLEMARQVSFQTAPQIRMLQRGNTKLIGKINSAFVVTIPIFKTGLINTIAAKRQNLVAKSMDELDRRTNELLIRNAQNISEQSVNIAKLAGQSSIKIETLEQSWNIIMEGLNETKHIEDENKALREQGRKKIEDLQKNYNMLQNK